jgi:hypothetical protein
MMNPILVYASIAVATAGFAGGWAVRSWKADAELKASYERLIAEKDRMQTKVDAASAKYEETRANLEPGKIETRNTIREIYRDVEVPAQCAAPVATVGVLQSARDRANAAAAGQSGPTVPSPSDRP